MANKLLYSEISKKIIKGFYNVYNHLGNGFLESVYEKALAYEFEELGLKIETQKSIEVFYKTHKCGNFIADILIEDKIIIELKAVSILNRHHEAQLLNYLKATGKRVGLLLNFGEKPEFKRMVL